jgi:hypothetical protein
MHPAHSASPLLSAPLMQQQPSCHSWWSCWPASGRTMSLCCRCVRCPLASISPVDSCLFFPRVFLCSNPTQAADRLLKPVAARRLCAAQSPQPRYQVCWAFRRCLCQPGTSAALLGHPAAVPFLVDLLGDGCPAVRGVAGACLDAIMDAHEDLAGVCLPGGCLRPLAPLAAHLCDAQTHCSSLAVPRRVRCLPAPLQVSSAASGLRPTTSSG